MTDYTIRRLLIAMASKGAPNLVDVVSITPAPSARQVQPTKAELAALTRCPDLALRFVILACSEAALRMGTACTVRLADIVAGRFATRTKKGAVTSTPVSPAIAALLATLPPDADTTVSIVELFNGGPLAYTQREIQKRFARWKKRCGVRAELRFHDMRRGLARRLYRATGDVRAVQKLLSHRSLASTLWYLDASEANVTVDALTKAIGMEQAL